MYLLVARYYIVRALITPLGKKNAEKREYMQKQQSKTKKKGGEKQVFKNQTGFIE